MYVFFYLLHVFAYIAGCGGLVVESPASEHEDTSSNLTGVGYLIMITIAKTVYGQAL
jgi:hypothetical protein